MSLKILSFLKRRWFWLFLFFPLLYLIAATSLSSDPILIDDGDVETLIEVIDDANDHCGMEDPVVIQLAAAGTYTLTEVYEDFNGDTGLPAIRCTLTILGNDATITRDALADPFRLLAVTSIGDLRLFDLTLTNGSANAGGALSNHAGILTLNHVSVIDNVATSGGGGIFNIGTLTIDNSSISGNSSGGGGGGGINLSAGTLDIHSTLFEGNTATWGGGIRMTSSGSNLIEWSVFTDNHTSSADGGAIFNQSSGSLTLSNVSILGNSANSSGGGVYNIGDLILTNHSLLSGNFAESTGGGLIHVADTLLLEDSRIADNDADFGGGIALSGSSTVEIADSALIGNGASQTNGGGAVRTLISITANGNCIEDNTIGGGSGTGLSNPLNANVNATGNWWDAAAGANTSGAQTTFGSNINTSSYLTSAPSSCSIQPDSTPTPTLTPTPTVPICEGFSLLEETCPTPTATPIGTYHIWCDLGTQARVRNFPSGFITATPPGGQQLDGHIRIQLDPGTVVTVYETRMGSDGILWARISPYDGYNNEADTLWVRTKGADNATDTLILGTPTGCSPLSFDLNVTPMFTPSSTSIPTVSPGCNTAQSYDCPHTNPGATPEEIVAFVLACEAGSPVTDPYLLEAQVDALAIAHVIYNRMDSFGYAGTALQVVSQSGQWQCYAQGATPSLNLSNFEDIDPVIVGYAQSLVNGSEPIDAPFDVHIDYMGLYTFGIGPSSDQNLTSTPRALATLFTPYCPDAQSALDLYLAIAPFGSRAYATVFFSSYTGCHL